jgi:L-lactate dehydrogenase (cytochrome)
MHPAWWANLLTTKPLTFASLTTWPGTPAELLNRLFDPTMTTDDLDWLRSFWDGPLIIKGIQTVEDAMRMVDAGADAIVLSNHGGRQLDRAPVPLALCHGSSTRSATRSGSSSGVLVARTSSPPSRWAPTASLSAVPISGLMAGGSSGRCGQPGS